MKRISLSRVLLSGIVRFTSESLDLSPLTAGQVMSTLVVVAESNQVDVAEAYHRLKLEHKTASSDCG